MAWLLRLPRVLQVPVALALIVGACFSIAVLAVMGPFILGYLWARRTWQERSACRALLQLHRIQGAAPFIIVRNPAGTPDEGSASVAGAPATEG